MAQMNTHTAVLSKEASSFERIAGELKGVSSRRLSPLQPPCRASGAGKPQPLRRPRFNGSMRPQPDRFKS
jgi:hypothetical protein